MWPGLIKLTVGGLYAGPDSLSLLWEACMWPWLIKLTVGGLYVALTH